ncbi:phage scaffolding protein [Clostridiales Family XIII bacterium ASD5510]|uniref:Phage scaffolding protein n=2 Tax=Bacteria TaxID=2 RepID=A0A9J6QZI6_9FIRM|nr:phage scaffolding protein [Hominibacterium faecale]MCU7380845.1 phage scaffolding protein [Hominibacterium faecale]
MKTEVLEGLLQGVENAKDIINKVMEENGKDIEAAKKDLHEVTVERDTLKEQLETTQNALKEFEGVDADGLKAKIEELDTKLKEQDAAYQTKLSDMEFQSALEKAVLESGAKNSKAAMALLDLDTLKGSKNRSEDIKAAIEAVKKDNDYLFGSSEPITNPTGPTGGGGGSDSMTATLRAAAGLPPKKED